MPADSIAFVATYNHPSRYSIEQMLRSAYPELQVEVFDVGDVISRHREWRLPGLWQAVTESPRVLLQGRATLSTRYRQSVPVVRRVKRAMRDLIDPRRHLFSFQTQSLYDTGVPGVPHFLYTDHTHLSNLASPFFDRRKLKSRAWIEQERSIYANATLVFTRSSNISADVVKHYGIPAEKVVCARFGANVEPPADYRPQNADYSNQCILFVGKDWERKGGPQLAQAFRQVLKVHPRARLVVAGAAPQLDLPNCEILGAQTFEQIQGLFARSSLLCGPSLLEPFGVAFIEAMWHRLPVVATHTGAIPEIVEDGVTGTLVPTNDPDALARALVLLLGDPALCRQYGEAGHARAASLYSWKAVGTHIRQSIDPLIAAPWDEPDVTGRGATGPGRHTTPPCAQSLRPH